MDKLYIVLCPECEFENEIPEDEIDDLYMCNMCDLVFIPRDWIYEGE